MLMTKLLGARSCPGNGHQHLPCPKGPKWCAGVRPGPAPIGPHSAAARKGRTCHGALAGPPARTRRSHAQVSGGK